MSKNNQKCVRMSDDILNIVLSCKGEGFNDKFENLVIDYKKSIPEREKYLQNLNMQIAEKLKDLKKLEDRFRGLKNFEFSLDNLRRDVLKIADTAASIIDVSQIVVAAPAPGLKNEIQESRRKKRIS